MLPPLLPMIKTLVILNILKHLGYPLNFYNLVPVNDPEAPLDEQQIARNVAALKSRLRGRGGRRGGRGGRIEHSSGRESAVESECVQVQRFLSQRSSYIHQL